MLGLNFISALTNSVTLPYLYNGDKELREKLSAWHNA